MLQALRQRWGYFLFLVLVPLLPLARPVLRGEAIGPHDLIRDMIPGRHGYSNSTAWDVLQADSVLQFYVWRDLVFDSWHRGQIPAWNPYVLGGTPLLANSQSGALYPPHILMGVVGVPTAAAITILAWFHLALAMFGVVSLCRRFGASDLGSTVAAASFGLSPFMLGWTPLASVITTMAWVPWMLSFGIKVIREGKGTAWFAFFVGMVLLGGHLQFAAYGLMALVFVAGFEVIQTKKWARSGVLVVGLGMGFLIAAPQLVPVLQFSKLSHRAGMAPNYDAYVSSAIKPFELANLVYPMALGNPQVRLQPGSETSTYWPPLAKRGANWTESAVSPGPMIVWLWALLPFAWIRLRSVSEQRNLIVPGVIALVFLLLAMGTPLNYLLYSFVPGWSATGSPGRAIGIFVLFGCVLGAASLTSFQARLPAHRPFQIAALGFVIFSFATLALGTTGVTSTNPETLEQFRAFVGSITAAGLPAAFLIIAFVPQAAVMGAFRRMNDEKVMPLLWLPSLIIVSLLWGFNRVIPSAEPINVSGFATDIEYDNGERLAFENNGWDIVNKPQAFLPPNIAALARIRQIGGYDSLMSKDTKQMLDEICGKDSSPPANGNIAWIKPGALPEKMAEAGVSTLFRKDSLRGIEVGGSRFSFGGEFDVIQDDPGHIVIGIKSGGEGTLIVRERNLPGWRVWVSGQEVPIGVETRWLEVPIKAGTTSVELRFETLSPWPLWGLAICLLGAATLFELKRPKLHTSVNHESS